MKKPLLVLLRHGESVWNAKNIFTGWIDIPLSPKGIDEALHAGHQMDKIAFGAVFTSRLVRAQMTACLAMSVHQGGKVLAFEHDDPEITKNMMLRTEETRDTMIPVYKDWRLNERMYGSLQGMNKDEARAQYGKEQVHQWRRSFDVPPPEGESLEMTTARTIPYFEKVIVPYLKDGQNILISAHGNSLRSIVYFIENMSQEEILNFEIPTGKPLCYYYDLGKFKKSDLSEHNR